MFANEWMVTVEVARGGWGVFTAGPVTSCEAKRKECEREVLLLFDLGSISSRGARQHGVLLVVISSRSRHSL
jgi:hypothetical protein